jgi:hypothetical protein
LVSLLFQKFGLVSMLTNPPFYSNTLLIRKVIGLYYFHYISLIYASKTISNGGIMRFVNEKEIKLKSWRRRMVGFIWTVSFLLRRPHQIWRSKSIGLQHCPTIYWLIYYPISDLFNYHLNQIWLDNRFTFHLNRYT